MSKNTKVAIGMIICAAILLAALALSLSGVVKSIISGGLSFGGITYSDAEKYTAGEAVIQDQVKNLDIHWINGQVNVAYHKENTIELKETSNKEITADLQLRWWVDGDTLRVQYAKSGFRTGSLNNQVKQLTITLPEGALFGNVSIDATSADLNVPSLKADSLSVDVTSGNINVSGEIKNLTAGATSGDMVLELTAQAKSIRTDATSGNVQIAAPGAEEIRTSSTSGDVKISAGTVKEVHTSSTSGSIECALEGFGVVDIDATSGNITLKLPQQPGFRAVLDTTSGDVDYNIPLSREGNTYICGDGSGQVSVNTTSGDILLQ